MFDFIYFSGLVILKLGVLLTGLAEMFDVFGLFELVVVLFAVIGIAGVFVLF